MNIYLGLLTLVTILFQLVSLKMGWVTVEVKGWYYSHYLWLYGNVIAGIGLFSVLTIKNIDVLNTVIWYLSIWVTVLALEPIWAEVAGLCKYTWNNKVVFYVWSTLFTLILLLILFYWIMTIQPTIRAMPANLEQFFQDLGKLTKLFGA